MFVFSHAIYYLRPDFSLSLLLGTNIDVRDQIRGHILYKVFLHPLHYVAFIYYRDKKTSALPSLVDSRRIAATDARRSQQLVDDPSFVKFAKKRKSKSHHARWDSKLPRPTLAAVER